jgi:hypothetical protein
MKPKKNKLLPEKNDSEIITNDILSQSKKNGCEDIGSCWKRTCPKCRKLIFHTRKDHRNWFEKKGSLCKSCSKIGKYVGRIVSNAHRQKISQKLKGRIPKNIKLLISCNDGRIYSDDTRNKMRNSRIEYLKRTNSYYYPNFNLNACCYFDKLNLEMGWNGIHAKNGGEYEIGNGKYFLDFYDVDRNIVVEYDEPHHYLSGGSLRNKDVHRMKDIKRSLQCRFYRYNVHQNKLKEC